MIVSEALASGTLTRQQLRSKYVKVHRDVHALKGLKLTARENAVAAWLWAHRDATLVGNSAAAMLGTKWIDDDEPAELSRMRTTSAPGILVRTGPISEDELTKRCGIPCTTPARTGYDIGRSMIGDAAIIRIDSLLNATRCSVGAVEVIASRYRGARGIKRLHSALTQVDAGAESPQETRLRLILVRGGLGPVTTQIPVANERGRAARRIDMGWPEWKVGVEYDGEQHFNGFADYEADIDRLDFLAARGWLIIRVSSRHMKNPPGIVSRAVHALISRGWSPSR